METFHLFHLASVWHPRQVEPNHLTIPPTNLPVDPTISPRSSRFVSLPSSPKHASATTDKDTSSTTRIRAAAVHMVFANRVTGDFVSPERAESLQKWAGEKVLQALASFTVDESVRDKHCLRIHGWDADFLFVHAEIAS